MKDKANEVNEVNEVNEELIELIDEIIDFKDVANSMITYAQNENDIVRNNSERYVPLDDVPYGEEVIRTIEIPEKLKEMLEELEELEDKKPIEIREIIRSATEELDSHLTEFNDCFNEAEIKRIHNESEES